MKQRQKNQPPSRPLSTVTVHVAPRNKSRALVKLGPITVPAALGRSGRKALKREGDGATPIGTMKLLYGFQRGERPQPVVTPLKIKRINKTMLWCDQSGHGLYNRPVRAPFRFSHETLMRPDHLYDICLVMDWNITCRRQNGGSAIFFHLARPGYLPTEGCVAVHPRDMKRLLPFLRKGTVVRVL